MEREGDFPDCLSTSRGDMWLIDQRTPRKFQIAGRHRSSDQEKRATENLPRSLFLFAE